MDSPLQCKEMITHKTEECEDGMVRIGELKDPIITAKQSRDKEWRVRTN